MKADKFFLPLTKIYRRDLYDIQTLCQRCGSKVSFPFSPSDEMQCTLRKCDKCNYQFIIDYQIGALISTRTVEQNK